jgi:hypothetical protein
LILNGNRKFNIICFLEVCKGRDKRKLGARKSFKIKVVTVNWERNCRSVNKDGIKRREGMVEIDGWMRDKEKPWMTCDF